MHSLLEWSVWISFRILETWANLSSNEMKHLGIRERRESNRVGIRSKDDKERQGQESKGNDCLWISEEKKNHPWNQKGKPNSGLSLVKIYIS